MKAIKSIFVIAIIFFITMTTQGQEIFDAVKNHNLAQVKALIEKDISLVSIKDNAGNTMLHNSVIIGSVEITEYLLSKGADINGVNTMLDTPLHEAINNGHDEVAKLLIVRGADVQKQNTMGNSPLHVAAHKNRKAVAELLIERGADLESKQVAQMTPLNLLALMTDNVDLAKLLIEKGADVNTKNRNGNTPLVNAAQHGSDGMIALLIEHNADFDTANNGATDLLITAAGRGSLGLFDYVMKKGGIVVFENRDGCKALMRSALSGGSLEIVKLLREKNIPLSFEPNVSGWTPLHRAAANNKPDMLEYLIKEGADINLRTKAGLSVYNIVEENGHNELLNLILKLGGNTESQKFPILSGLYLGQKPPGKMPERFAPDIFIYNHSTVTVSPDGKEMYWNSGPKFGEGPIMMTKIVDGKWIKPVEAPFSGKQYSKFDDCPFVSPDNKRLFFISMRPLGSRADNKENIWYVERTSSGWSEPKPVSEEINAMKLHWQISVSKDGTLYFNGRNEEGPFIRYSRCVNGVYAKPENTGIDGMSPYISPDESYLLFSRLVSNRPVPFLCFKSKGDKWNEPIDLQQYIGNNVCCIVSPDGKYLFKDSYWVDASFIEELRPKE